MIILFIDSTEGEVITNFLTARTRSIPRCGVSGEMKVSGEERAIPKSSGSRVSGSESLVIRIRGMATGCISLSFYVIVEQEEITARYVVIVQWIS
jgi:hypothetical protein